MSKYFLLSVICIAMAWRSHGKTHVEMIRQLRGAFYYYSIYKL